MLGNVLNNFDATQKTDKKNISLKNIDKKDPKTLSNLFEKEDFKTLLQKNLPSKELEKSPSSDLHIEKKVDPKVEKKALEHSDQSLSQTQSAQLNIQTDKKDPKTLSNLFEKEDFKTLLQKNLPSKELEKSPSSDLHIEKKVDPKVEKKALEHSDQSLSQTAQKTTQNLSTISHIQPIQTSQKENAPNNQIQSKKIPADKPMSTDTPSLKNILAQTKTPDEKSLNSNMAQKNLSDIAILAEQKNLHPQKISAQIAKNPTDSSAKTTHSTTNKQISPILENNSLHRTNTQISDNKPLALLLNTIESKHKEQELKERKSFNKAHKIEYKFEGKTQKIAIIERGKTLPKNIVGQKLRQEEKEIDLKFSKSNDRLDLKKNDKSSNAAIAEDISKVFVKNVALKNTFNDIANAEESKIKTPQEENAKTLSQKKTKKSNILGKKSSVINTQKIDEKNPEAKFQTILQTNKNTLQENQQENQIEQQNQEIFIQKTKKKHSDKEVQKDKTQENPKESASVLKDSSQALGMVPKTDLSHKIASAKTTIKNFAQNLNEELKKYKPPMSKISLELHPEKLGKLELTIKQSGNNLHISVISNSQAIALFVQNQAELRQNLATIGFGDANLNFSSKDDSQNSQQDSRREKRNKNSLREYEDIKNVTSIPYDSMEIVLPKYI